LPPATFSKGKGLWFRFRYSEMWLGLRLMSLRGKIRLDINQR